MMGYSAVTDNIDLAVQIPLYLGCVAWTVMYDTVYALQDIDDDRKLGLNTSADFRQLPKEYRANPAKAFRNHRTRQKIMHYQTQEQSKFLASCQSAMFLSLVCWATVLETRGTIIAADSLVIFTGALMAANYAWYHYGCGAFAGQTADKVKYLEFFKRQKWIGFWLMFSLLIAHGLVRNLRLYDDDLNRVYLLKEESREILTAIQPLLPSSLD
ncbi:unnamed protein product [Oikopleura dioica]|uniref:Uncharacterized protein n=2 Tax=Oikopleura dioica TaxID=34765 RepID=E4YNI2_OIKDI|nr:unnamed protein product [Oikopleura dioica]